MDLAAAYPAAAERIRGNKLRVSAGGLESAMIADPTIKERYDEAGLQRLLHDGELLAERLASCVASGEDRWLTEYAEWAVPVYRRRGIPLRDLSELCAGMRDTLQPQLSPDEFAVASRSLDAAADIFARSSRIAGDRHRRNALWRWMYRGV